MQPVPSSQDLSGRRAAQWQPCSPPVSTDFMDRRNTSKEALGDIKRFCVRGIPIYRSPDWWAYLVTTSITACIVFGNMFVTWDHLHVAELAFCWTLLIIAHFSSFRLITSDPGIYPRLGVGEADPLGQSMDLVFCRVCRMRRPLRTSHCYECNVCVLEHDHHCGILGGCVGMRSLRWFTLYLCAVSLSAACGLFWQTRYLAGLFFSEGFSGSAPRHGAVEPWQLVSRSPQAVQESPSSRPVFPILSLGVFLVDMGVVSVVGCAAGYYLILTLTDTTRRESQRHETSLGTLKQPRVVVRNIKKTIFPPPSLVEPVDTRFLDVEEDLAPLVC